MWRKNPDQPREAIPANYKRVTYALGSADENICFERGEDFYLSERVPAPLIDKGELGVFYFSRTEFLAHDHAHVVYLRDEGETDPREPKVE